MSDNSGIEWTDATWGPVLGCDKVSAGCAGCYAVRSVHRMAANPNPKLKAACEGLTMVRGNGQLDWSGVVRCLPERLEIPLKWKKPRRVFVNSQSDLWHPNVPFEFIDKVFAIMAMCPQHTFQVLTKRPQRMVEYLSDATVRERLADARTALFVKPDISRHLPNDPTSPFKGSKKTGYRPLFEWPLPNVWLGVSVENQQTADERIPLLLQTPAAVRWLSCEPLLGPVDLTPPQYRGTNINLDDWLQEIGWIVVGGESGPNARPMHPDWAREIRDRCVNRRDMGRPWPLPFFFKQTGEWMEVPESEGGWGDQFLIRRLRLGCEGTPRHYAWDLYPWKYSEVPMAGAEAGRWSPWRDVLMRKVGKKTTGRLLDGRTWDEYPQAQEGQHA